MLPVVGASTPPADMTLSEATLRLLRQRKEHITEAVASGAKSWEAYQRLLGELDALNWVEQELLSLRKQQELDND